NMTYKQFLNDEFIPYYKNTVEDSTFKGKKVILSKLEDRFGDLVLRNITSRDIVNFRTYLLSSKKDGGAEYGKAYASIILGTVKQTLEFAVRMDIISHNVANKVKPISKVKATSAYWTEEDFKKVIRKICIANFLEQLYFVAIWLYFMTGVRVNEGTALRWKDVDVENGKMWIHHMLIGDTKKNYHINDYTKTKSGKRTLSLDKMTIKVLKGWKIRQKQHGLGNQDDFILSHDGTPLMKSTLNVVLKRYAKAANVPEIQPKGLRHSHASYLINKFNASVLVVSKRLGHSSPQITLETYSHLWGNTDEELVKMMDNDGIEIKTSDKSNIYPNLSEMFPT
ncbi:site-specific integrase, partial [Apilactobacillus sp. F1]|nr:site-specific integrase [Apilactobacillus sp. F1]